MRDFYCNPGTAVEVKIDPDNSPDVWFPATFIRETTNNSFLVKYQSSQNAGLQEVTVDFGRIRPSPPQSSNKGFSLLEKVDAFHDFRWLSGVVTKILASGRYTVYFKRMKKEKELSHADLRLTVEWTNGKWVHSSQDLSITSASGKQLDYAVGDGHEVKTCAPAVCTGSDEHLREEINHTETLNRSHRVMRTPDNEKEDNKSTILSKLRINKSIGDVIPGRLNPMSGALSSPPSCNSRLKLTDAFHNEASTVLDSSSPNGKARKSFPKSADSNQPSNPIGKTGDDEQHPVRRKRGRPPKKENSQKLQALEQDDGEQTAYTSGDFSPQGPIVVGLTCNGKMIESVSGSSGVLTKGKSSKVMEEDEEKCNNTEANHESAGIKRQKSGEGISQKRRRGRPPKVLVGAGKSPTKDAENGDNSIEKAAKVLAGISSNVSEDEDRPLSAWFEGAHSPPATDGGPEIVKTKRVGQPSGQEDPIVSVDNRGLPFVKTSLIWAMIESMDVIKQIPQNPHFRPLYDRKEECREGLAIGSMVTFTSLADRISKLRFDESGTVSDGYFEALADLENLGFNVGPVRDKLNTLISIKGRYEQTRNTVNEIETQIVDRDHEKLKIDEEIEEIDRKVAELNEKREMAMSKREMKDAEMRILKFSVHAVKGSLERCKEEFQKVATSGW